MILLPAPTPETRMLSTLALTLTLLPAADIPAPAARPQAVNPRRLANTLRSWLRDYLKGKYELGNNYKNISSKSLGKKGGFIEDATFNTDRGVLKPGQFSYHEEIGHLLELAGKANALETSQALLLFCTVGLDDTQKYYAADVPFHVRHKAEEALASVGDTDTHTWLDAVAQGDIKISRVSKKSYPALQAAALRVLGKMNPAGYSGTIQKGLQSKDQLIRLMAAESLSQTKMAANLGPLVQTLSSAKTEFEKLRLHNSVAQLIMGCRHKVEKSLHQKAGDLHLADLGGDWGWAYQSKLVEIGSFYGRKEVIPKLIDVLEKFVKNPADLASGKLTGILRNRAYDKLTSLTNQFYPMNDIQNWRAWWQRNEAKFQFAAPTMSKDRLKARWEAEEKKRLANDPGAKTTPPPPSAGMSQGTFFGIRVKGSRVLFIIDTTRDMSLPIQVSNARYQDMFKKGMIRSAAAAQELSKALEGLTADTQFNILTFDERIKWASKKLLRADPGGLKKGLGFVKKLRSSQSHVNLGDALVAGLGAEQIYPDQSKCEYDEIFVLSNRRPNRGSVRDYGNLIDLCAGQVRLSGTRINTVFIGTINDENDKQKIGQQVMENIAKSCDGTFVRT